MTLRGHSKEKVNFNPRASKIVSPSSQHFYGKTIYLLRIISLLWERSSPHRCAKSVTRLSKFQTLTERFSSATRLGKRHLSSMVSVTHEDFYQLQKANFFRTPPSKHTRWCGSQQGIGMAKSVHIFLPKRCGIPTCDLKPLLSRNAESANGLMSMKWCVSETQSLPPPQSNSGWI